MIRTHAEDLFERFRAERNIMCEMIDTDHGKTHDYDIEWYGLRIAVEIKQLECDYESLKNGKLREHSTTPGDHIRRKINKAGKQIKTRTAAEYPSLLVIYNAIYPQINIYSEPYDFLVAMYGLEKAILKLPDDRRVKTQGSKFGGRRKMTECMNTSLSALACLREGTNESLNLDIYHNRYAAVPLDISATRAEGVRHFIVPRDMEQFTQWEEIE